MSSRDESVNNKFTGETESVVQAGAVHGGIHYYGRKNNDFPPPRQLPTGPRGFVNRKSSLEQLDALLVSWNDDADRDHSSGPVIAAIIGAPGVGKTALALHWAHQVRHRFVDGDLYIDMRGYGSAPPVSLEQALDSFLRSLNVDPEQIPIDVDERAALFRSILGDKNVLVVVDNVASVKQIRYLLPGSHRCLALVTSRSRLSSLVAREGATRVNIDVLSPEDAVQLLAEIIGEERVESDYDAAGRVAALCSYLPLALRVVAERAAARPHLSLSELVRELESEQSRLDALASEEDELTDVRAVFSWSYRALLPEQQKVFRLLGLHVGTEFGSAVAAALGDVSAPTVKHQLQELASVHLVQQVGPDRYRLHDLLRAYSVERNQREEPQRERTHAVRRMLAWYVLAADIARRIILPNSHAVPLVPAGRISVPSFGDVESAMDWYETERLNLLGALQLAMDLGQYDIAWKLPVVSDGFFELRSYWVEWKQIHLDGLIAAETIDDNLGVASNLLCLGDVSWRLGTYDEALKFYERSTVIAHTIGDRWLEGFSLRGIGLVHQERENLAASIEYFTRALDIFRSEGIPRGEGMSLLSIGKSYRGLGDFQNAVDYCGSAVAIFRSIGDSWSRAWGLMPLAEVTREMGQFEASERYLRDALSIFQDFADRRSEALALDALGAVLHEMGDDFGARECWTNALNIFEDLGDPHAERVHARISSLDGE